MEYSIGETAKRMHISTATLCYYDQEGLIPYVKRSPGGARVFTEEVFRWLNLISCLKKAGMPLKDIRCYIDMVKQGEATLEARLEMFTQQRKKILQQMEDLQRTLDVVDYKCWYYETAISHGSEQISKNMPENQLPEKLRPVRQWLRAETK